MIHAFSLTVCIVALTALIIKDIWERSTRSVRVVHRRSMVPTLMVGMRCVSVSVGRFTRLRRGDIVCITRRDTYPSSLVKRIIAIPGDTVLMSDMSVWVNGILLDENYLAPRSIAYTPGLFKLGEDEYWIMGDNRDEAVDSRHFGPVKRAEISRKLLPNMATR